MRTRAPSSLSLQHASTIARERYRKSRLGQGRGLVTSGVVTPADLLAIDRGNAERLIPPLRFHSKA
jgi:hypothetical protein